MPFEPPRLLLAVRASFAMAFPTIYWSRDAELVGNLGVDVVNAAARRLLAPETLTWVVIGDLGMVEDDVSLSVAHAA